MASLSFLIGKSGKYQEIHTVFLYYLTASLQQKPKPKYSKWGFINLLNEDQNYINITF